MGQYEKWSNIAPFPFGSLVGQLQNMEQYGAIWKVGQPMICLHLEPD